MVSTTAPTRAAVAALTGGVAACRAAGGAVVAAVVGGVPATRSDLLQLAASARPAVRITRANVVDMPSSYHARACGDTRPESRAGWLPSPAAVIPLATNKPTLDDLAFRVGAPRMWGRVFSKDPL